VDLLYGVIFVVFGQPAVFYLYFNMTRNVLPDLFIFFPDFFSDKCKSVGYLKVGTGTVSRETVLIK
jgi:hypothetical protein